MAEKFEDLRVALLKIKRDQTDTLALDLVLDSKHSDSIVIVKNILKSRFLKELVQDPDVYNAIASKERFELFKYFSPEEAEIYVDKKLEKDEYFSLKKDSALLQFGFKLTMKGLIAYIVIRIIYESF